MNDMLSLDVRAVVAAFVGEVERRLADLTPDERDELVGGLPADLAERLGEHDGPESATEVLGDPGAYAEELRAAAGLAPGTSNGGGRRSLGAIVSGLLDAARRSWVQLLDSLPGSPRAFLETLQPVWWVLRAWVAWMLAQDVAGWDARVSYQPEWLVVLVVLVVGSVQLGRGAAARLARLRAPVAARLVLVALNVLALCLLPGAVDRARGDAADDLAEQRGYAARPSIGAPTR